MARQVAYCSNPACNRPIFKGERVWQKGDKLYCKGDCLKESFKNKKDK